MYSDRELSIEIDARFERVRKLITENIRDSTDRALGLSDLAKARGGAYRALRSRHAKKEDRFN